jgi:hypothetical protein
VKVNFGKGCKHSLNKFVALVVYHCSVKSDFGSQSEHLYTAPSALPQKKTQKNEMLRVQSFVLVINVAIVQRLFV